MYDNDYYEDHIKGKQKRKGKKGRRRNPIASSHQGGDWGSGPMLGEKDKKKPKYPERYFDDGYGEGMED